MEILTKEKVIEIITAHFKERYGTNYGEESLKNAIEGAEALFQYLREN